MWIAEGFIQPNHGSGSHDDRLEEIAAGYYKELITRNLIERRAESSATGYSCTMHDVVRSFAEFIARGDSLVVQGDSNRASSGSSNNNDNDDDDDTSLVRRMSVGPSELVPDWAVVRKQDSSTIITLIIHCKINIIGPYDSLASFSRLRVLSIKGGGVDCDRLVGSLCELRHLRHICLEETNISKLPENIHKMIFLQHILIRGSKNLENLPSGIVKLVHLRTLDTYGSNADVVIPKGFGGLTSLRTLLGFPARTHMDGGWCSLQEIGPLSHLRKLHLHGLENVPASSLAEKAMVSSKEHLDYLMLHWSSSGWMELRGGREKQQRQQHVAEEVLEKLCPPPGVQHLIIQGYFGRMLPNWTTAPATGAFNSLTILNLLDLPCCTKLPDGLCQLLSLKVMSIEDAPAIKNVGFEFQASSSSLAAFPNLMTLQMEGLCEWEQWDWEEQGGGCHGHACSRGTPNC
jgi:hypothetical protein